VKDENTKVERKTKWDAGKLVSEVNGLGRGKITETYAVDPEHKELIVTLTMENQQSGHPATQKRVYIADAK